MIYGYARVSTPQQSIERQIRNIKEFDQSAVIYQEHFTGTTLERPAFKKLLKKLKSGDTVIFDSVSRMSRTAQEGFDLYKQLYSKGISIIFLKEPYVNSDNYREALQKELAATGNEIADIYIEATNRVLMILAERQFFQAFEQSEKEVKDLQERTREGMMTAAANGKQIGRKPGTRLTTKRVQEALTIIQKVNRSFGGTLTDKETIALVKLDPHTFYKYKKQLLES